MASASNNAGEPGVGPVGVARAFPKEKRPTIVVACTFRKIWHLS